MNQNLPTLQQIEDEEQKLAALKPGALKRAEKEGIIRAAKKYESMTMFIFIVLMIAFVAIFAIRKITNFPIEMVVAGVISVAMFVFAIKAIVAGKWISLGILFVIVAVWLAEQINNLVSIFVQSWVAPPTMLTICVIGFPLAVYKLGELEGGGNWLVKKNGVILTFALWALIGSILFSLIGWHWRFSLLALFEGTLVAMFFKLPGFVAIDLFPARLDPRKEDKDQVKRSGPSFFHAFFTMIDMVGGTFVVIILVFDWQHYWPMVLNSFLLAVTSPFYPPLNVWHILAWASTLGCTIWFVSKILGKIISSAKWWFEKNKMIYALKT